MRFRWLALALVLLVASPAAAQISITYTFTAGTIIDPDQMNNNFSTITAQALNRTGGTITGNIAASANVTIDGADISDYLDGSGNVTVPGTIAVTGVPTFSNSGVVIRGVTYAWPAADGSSGHVLTTDGAGAITWATKANALLDGANHSDTLAGTVTRGDLIVGNSTPKWSELAIGTASKVLRSDGTDVAWSWPSLSSQSSTFSAGDGGDYYLVTATATANLPACNAGRAGKWFHFKLTAASSTVTLDGDSSETIDGATTYAFSERYTSISIVCNGSGAWSIF